MEDFEDLALPDDATRASHYFGRHTPQYVEHYSYVPAYPKSHPNGFATVVELPDKKNDTEKFQWSSKKLQTLRQAMQYTLTGGRGDRLVEHVEYFEPQRYELEFEDIPMYESVRKCAGVKVINHYN